MQPKTYKVILLKKKNKSNTQTYNNQTEKAGIIQWHSAFRGAIKTELSNETVPLEYREEHAITKKPLNVDLIVIQKNRKEKLQNTIGHIFRTFNIMEYKGPDDSLSVNDFYKVYAYACIFKSDSTETIFPAAGCGFPAGTLIFLCWSMLWIIMIQPKKMNTKT